MKRRKNKENWIWTGNMQRELLLSQCFDIWNSLCVSVCDQIYIVTLFYLIFNFYITFSTLSNLKINLSGSKCLSMRRFVFIFFNCCCCCFFRPVQQRRKQMRKNEKKKLWKNNNYTCQNNIDYALHAYTSTNTQSL